MRGLQRRDILWLGSLCLLLLLVLLPFYSYAALLLLIQKEWGMSSAEAGLVNGATQAGYVVAVILLVPMTDRMKSSYIIVSSAAVSVVANSLFPLLAHDVVSGTLLRFIGGMGVGGVYMPGMRMISERFSAERRGTPIGIYVAAFVLGAAVSLFVAAGLVPWFGWRGTYLVASLSSLVSVALAAVHVRGEKSPKSLVAVRQRKGSSLRAILRNKGVMLMSMGYTGHVFELYGMRAWIPPFLASILMRTGDDLTSATAQGALVSSTMVLLGSMTSVLGGSISDRLGRTATAGVISLISAACSLTLGWLIGAPFWVVLAVCVLYGLSVAADSPLYSTGVTESAPRERLGTAMAVQTTSGWTAGIISPIVFGMILDLVRGDAAWGVAFGVLGMGGLVSIVAMVLLRRSPESKLLAGGRR